MGERGQIRSLHLFLSQWAVPHCEKTGAEVEKQESQVDNLFWPFLPQARQFTSLWYFTLLAIPMKAIFLFYLGGN